MSVPAVGWAIEQGCQHGLTVGDRMILVYLADKANGALVCWPGQELIGKYTGLSSRWVREGTARLESAGLIKMGWRGKVRLYYILRPINGEDYNPTHRNSVPVDNSQTPELSSGSQRNSVPVAAALTGTTRHSHRNSVPKTPELSSDYPSKEPSNEPKTRASAREPAKDSKIIPLGRKSAEPAPPPEPPAVEPERTPAEVEAARKRTLADIAAMPAPLAAAVRSLANAFEHRYHGPGRWPELTAEEQIAQVDPTPTVKPRYLTGAQLAAARAVAGVRVGASA